MDTPTPLRARGKGQRMKAGQRRSAKRRFLENYALQGLKAAPRVATALQAAGMSRSALYQWLKADQVLKAKYEALQAVYFLPWYYCPAALHDPEFDQERKHHQKQRTVGKRLIRYYYKQAHR
ncbi:MAG TPA: hypothetical protein VFV38_17780 [Ktedonobacteraceae bacterium]|nr:hypothetical protein [Ktedonobacteraceae bacterium]